MSVSLSVNLNKVALLRNSRTDNNPNIAEFAQLSIDAGAQGLTAHPRPDQRHIRPDDVFVLSEIAKKNSVEFNIEGNPFSAPLGDYPGLLTLVSAVKPDQCTLVPDSDAQLTSDHGFDLHQDFDRLIPIIKELKALNIRISLFMDPVLEQIKLASEVGADRIELYTGPFAEAFHQSEGEALKIYQQHQEAAEYAYSLGLGVNAGHDLSLDNLKLYTKLPHLSEVSIGHALTADALRLGFYQAVQAYQALCAHPE